MISFKEKFNLYKKEKGTILAFIFFVVFLVLLIISYIPSLNYISGVRNDFDIEKINFMSSNGTDTTYLVSKDNHLFYSLYKNSDMSHLNKFTGTKNLGNEYADPTSHLDNFIYVDYEFDSKIIKVEGETDYRKGYTLVLTKNGSLYYIDEVTTDFRIIENNVKDFSKMYTNIIVKYTTGELKYFDLYDNSISFSISNDNYQDIFFSNVDDDNVSFYYTKDSNLYYNQIDKNTKLSITNNKETIENIKYVSSNGSATILVTNDNKIIGIDDKEHTFSNDKFTYIDNNYGTIEKIYSSGEFSFIFNINNQNYYLGKIYNNSNEEYNKLTSLNNDYDYIYSGKYSTIVLKNNKLYLYDKDSNKYVGMYKNYFVSYVLKYLSLFVVAMIIFYFIYSFFESSARYNRYFKDRDRKKDISNDIS